MERTRDLGGRNGSRETERAGRGLEGPRETWRDRKGPRETEGDRKGLIGT